MNASVAAPESATPTSSQSLGRSMEDIEALDLTLIKLKLQDTEEGPGWSAEKCGAVEVDYKRFLALKRAYPEAEIVPNREVDLFWHQHILDTEKYAEDCEALFGTFCIITHTLECKERKTTPIFALPSVRRRRSMSATSEVEKARLRWPNAGLSANP